MGSDYVNQRTLDNIFNFNPRSRMGSDKYGCFNASFCIISIHAPAWGATLLADTPAATDEFQSTLPHGERHTPGFAKAFFEAFQSTLPHGERPNHYC